MHKPSPPFKIIPEWSQPGYIGVVLPRGMRQPSLTGRFFRKKLYHQSLHWEFDNLIEALKNFYLLHKAEILIFDQECSADVKYKPGRKFQRLPVPSGTDIWIRDWAPLPAWDVSGRKVFVKAQYRPAYLTAKEALPMQNAGTGLADALGIPCVDFPLIWDPGNLTHNGNGAGIVSQRILKDNPGMNIKEIRNLFRRFLSIDKLVIIDEEPGDITGHIDSNFRFLWGDALAVSVYPSELVHENRYIKNCIAKIKRDLNIPLKIIGIKNGVLFDDKIEGMNSLFGNHLNFLRAGRLLLAPCYGITSDREIPALGLISPDLLVHPVPAAQISHYGGSLNCVTWTG